MSLFALVGSNDTSTKRDASANLVPTNVRMQRDIPYTINKGDEIEKLSANPKIKLESDLNSGKTIVTLLSGEAAIIKK
jgi:hypothetical protein